MALHLYPDVTSSSNAATVSHPVTIDGTPRDQSDVKDILLNGSDHETCRDNSSCHDNSASSVEEELDRSREACEDLYGHVCSRWENRYRGLAEERGSYSFDDFVIDRHAKYLGHLLGDADSPFPR
ncbi:hypothetical protein MTO96_049360 [Rhipicephalus appendiculatus]